MDTYIIVDSRATFLQGIDTYCEINDFDFDLVCINSTNAILETLNTVTPKAIIIADNAAESIIPDCNVVIFGYGTTLDAERIFIEQGISFVGYVKKPSDLLALIEKGLSVVKSPAASSPKTVEQAEVKAEVVQKKTADEIAREREREYDRKIREVAPGSEFVTKDTTGERNFSEEYLRSSAAHIKIVENEDAQQELDENTGIDVAKLKKIVKEEKKEDEAVSIEDIIPQKKTKTIAVYSAKGGVGKTTISCELATQLALTTRGRGKLRVCIVDYNIDFGDVATTLGFDESGVDLCTFGAKVDSLVMENEREAASPDKYKSSLIESLSSGILPESYSFTQSEIESYLQKKKFTEDMNFYGLIAPVVHNKSMSISTISLYVMLLNIIRNGNFDFIICDTGNNTRDSAIVALTFADYVYMICTQDVTTANCNSRFLATMREINFDEKKIRLIVNNVINERLISVSVADIAEVVPYPLIAQIPRDTAVINANNRSEPIVFEVGNSFSREMRRLSIQLLQDGEQFSMEVPKKKGFFSRLFGK